MLVIYISDIGSLCIDGKRGKQIKGHQRNIGREERRIHKRWIFLTTPGESAEKRKKRRTVHRAKRVWGDSLSDLFFGYFPSAFLGLAYGNLRRPGNNLANLCGKADAGSMQIGKQLRGLLLRQSEH